MEFSMYARHAVVDSSLGEITLVAADASITGLYFPRHWYPPTPEMLGVRVAAADDPLLADAERQLTDYLAGARTSFDLPLATHGDPLQESVWAILREIPFGTTTTYGEIAMRLGNRSLAQAVGQAVGHNPISIIVPCHRVVGSDGKLTGFAGGLRRKQLLLELEEPTSVKAGRLF
jgi:methylated-DNA-[protein]-cysteine S-methyltransferase